MHNSHMYIDITGNGFSRKKILQVSPIPDVDTLEQMHLAQNVLGLDKEYTKVQRVVQLNQYELLRNLLYAGKEYYGLTDDHLAKAENAANLDHEHPSIRKERKAKLNQRFLSEVLQALYDLGMREESLALRNAYKKLTLEYERTSYPQTYPAIKLP